MGIKSLCSSGWAGDRQFRTANQQVSTGQPISRILLPGRVCAWHGSQADGHLSRPDVTIRLVQPTRDSSENGPFPAAEADMVSAWPCSSQGLPGRRITTAPVVSCTTFSPLPLRAVCFCGPVRQVLPKDPRPGCYPVTCPVECGLSSTLIAQRRDHLAGLCASSYPVHSASSITGKKSYNYRHRLSNCRGHQAA